MIEALVVVFLGAAIVDVQERNEWTRVSNECVELSPEPQRISIFVPTNHYHIVALLCLNVSYSVVVIVRTSVICVNTLTRILSSLY